MKTSLYKTIFSLLLLLFLSANSHAQRFIIKVRPTPPIAVRIASPGPRHVWVEGDWVWRNGAYVYQPGYWHLPRGRERWVSGHWKKTRGGWYWVPGHWARKRWR